MSTFDEIRTKILNAVGNPGPIFHTHDGLYFTRFTDGSVGVVHDPSGLVMMLDANTWASVVASMSAKGEDSLTFNAALRFHQQPAAGGQGE